MKYRTLRHWENPGQLEGLAFFSQLIEELLFDYSLDTYKPSAMNTSTLCKEALSLIEDIENETIDKANLKHVLNELVINLRNDEIAKSLLDISAGTIALKLENDSCPIQEKKTIVEIINSQLNIFLYKKRAEELLVEAVKCGKEKDRIRSLARSYITTLISVGYSSRYLYPTSRQFFHWPGNKITSTDDITKYFDFVSGQDYEYVAIFKAEIIFEDIKDSCKYLDIEITRTLSDELEGFADSKNYTINDKQTYLIVNKIKEKDVFSARSDAERRIEIITALVNLFHHKKIPEWEGNALLVNLEKKTPRLINLPRNPMLLCSDLRTHDAAVKLNSLFNDFSLSDQHSFKKFSRVTELHSLALKNDAPENQLLSLWVGLETISPSRISKNKAKVNNIIDSILPFLSLDYIYTLTNKLTLDFKLWNRTALFRSIDGIDGNSEREKLIKLLVLSDYEDNKNELFDSLGNFYLLRNRAHYFSEVLSSKKNVIGLLEKHWVRVDWQIRRIYRTRNQIVHAGHTPLYIDVLIKNVHDYLDVVINGISYLASIGEKINTVDQAFKYTEIKYHEYLHELKTEVGDIDHENILRLIINKRI